MSATIKDFLECFKTSIKTRKLSRVWPWNLAVVAFCCHLPLQYKWSSLSVQTAEMCFYMLHQKPQVSTALSWPKISAVCFPSLTALPNASSVNQHTRHKSIFSGRHFHFFFFFWVRQNYFQQHLKSCSRSAGKCWCGRYSPPCLGGESSRLFEGTVV